MWVFTSTCFLKPNPNVFILDAGIAVLRNINPIAKKDKQKNDLRRAQFVKNGQGHKGPIINVEQVTQPL